MPTSRPQIAFVAAALVLLVLPLTALLGISAIGMAVQIGALSRIEEVLGADANTVLFVLSFVWVLLITAVVIAVVARLIRATRT